MSYVTTQDNTRLYVKQWGNGQPVVLVHGWPLSSDTWDGIAFRLAKGGYQAIAYDRRGFGRSGQPWTGYDYDTLAGDLGCVIDQLQLEKVHLVGFSMGGGEVVRYTSKHADRVKSIALLGSIIPFLLQQDNHPEGVPNDVFAEMQAGILQDRSDFFAKFFPNFYGNGILSKAVSEATLEWTRTVAMQAGLKGILDCIDSFARTDFRYELPGITAPALLVHGTADQIVPIDITSRAAAKLLPNSRLFEIDGGSHGILATHEAIIAEQLLVHLGNSR